MSIYSITEDSSTRDTFNYQRLNKFNRFYLLKNNFSSKMQLSNPAIINSRNKYSKGIFDIIPKTPTKASKGKSQICQNSHKKMNLKRRSYKHLNTVRIKKKFSPDILEAQLISKPKKVKKKRMIKDFPNINTFLANKIKTKSFHLNAFELLNVNNSRLLTSMLSKNKPKINNGGSFRDSIIKNKFIKKNGSIVNSMKLLIHNSNKSNKKSEMNKINKFKRSLINEKRESLREYNKFMYDLNVNLSKSKSKSKPKTNFFL